MTESCTDLITICLFPLPLVVRSRVLIYTCNPIDFALLVQKRLVQLQNRRTSSVLESVLILGHQVSRVAASCMRLAYHWNPSSQRRVPFEFVALFGFEQELVV